MKKTKKKRFDIAAETVRDLETLELKQFHGALASTSLHDTAYPYTCCCTQNGGGGGGHNQM